MKTLLARVVLLLALLATTPALSRPQITDFSPKTGPTTGGTEVTVTGTELDQVTGLELMGTNPQIKSQTATQIVFTTELMLGSRGPCGRVNWLSDNDGSSSIENFCASPVITGVSPSAGPIEGGTTVTITGFGFYPLEGDVMFGTVGADPEYFNENSITVETPPGVSLGAVDVSVHTYYATGIIENAYTYVGAPTITSVSPNQGAEVGGNTVTIHGTDFAGATRVEFGDFTAANFTVVSNTEITVSAPAGVGITDITVIGAVDSVRASGAYTYVAAPSIVAITPANGPLNGATVQISGVNLAEATVTFGGSPGNVLANIGTSIMVMAPAHPAGSVDVAVTTPGGSATISDGFEYLAPTTISSIDPAEGPSAGGTTVTITGSGFAEATSVNFGATAGTDLDVVSDTKITVRTPAGTGSVDVSVLAPGGSQASVGAFSYIDNGTITLRQLTTGGDGSFIFSSATPDLNLAIRTTGGAGESAPITLPAGDYTISALQHAGFGLTAVSCSAGGVGDLASATATITLGPGSAVICTFTSFASEAAATTLIQDYFAAQGAVILANLPDGQRRIDRLRGTVDAPGTTVPALMGYAADAASGALAMPAITGSLAQFDALTGKPPSPFDIWFEATFGAYDADRLSGNFGIVALGADYRVNDSLLLGGFLQGDVMPDGDNGSGGSISGQGWLAGPYATMRLTEGLYLDILAGAGQSTNEISPDGTYTDAFEASRWLASATLSGQIEIGDWTIAPTASLGYYQSTSETYLDDLGVNVPTVTGGLGQLALGPDVSYRFVLENGVVVNTSLGLSGVLDFTLEDELTTTRADGRVTAAVNVATPDGARFAVSAGLDGLGGGTSVLSGNVSASIPFD